MKMCRHLVRLKYQTCGHQPQPRSSLSGPHQWACTALIHVRRSVNPPLPTTNQSIMMNPTHGQTAEWAADCRREVLRMGNGHEYVYSSLCTPISTKRHLQHAIVRTLFSEKVNAAAPGHPAAGAASQNAARSLRFRSGGQRFVSKGHTDRAQYANRRYSLSV